MTNDFFKGLKVIELASVLAGPAVGMFFAELGAEVIKVENKLTGGDITRKWKLPNEDPSGAYSGYYCCVNWGKKTVLKNLKDPGEQQSVVQLIQSADIVISNFKVSSAKRFGMDFESVRPINPTIIYAQLHAFGPEEERPAYDIVLQAEAGFLHMCGEKGGNPVKMPVALIDLIAAHQLKEAILIALIKRLRTGEGSYVETSLFESAIASLANQATNWLMAGHLPQRMGTK
ncbi:MAG: CoA transferase, partial [Saprospiraceae bacterium]|nr:CoA transferase [Saprospiraceae bacterium]